MEETSRKFAAVWPKGSEELSLWRVKTPKTKARDWQSIWSLARQACDGKGVAKEGMKARADSPIWGVLGTAFRDSTGSKTPAWFWNSGIGAKDKKGNIYYQARMAIDRRKESEEENEDFELDDPEIKGAVEASVFGLLADIPRKITIEI